jgi:arabinogalactan endo-1,4-beta-galactosidase
MAKAVKIKSIRKEVESYLQKLANGALKEIEDVMSDVLIHAMDNQALYEKKFTKEFKSDERSTREYEVKIGTRYSKLNKWSKRLNKKLYKPADDFAKDVLSRFYGYDFTLEKIAEDNEAASKLPLTSQDHEPKPATETGPPSYTKKTRGKNKPQP